jgi:uncharacterized protein (UPF0332 family)
MMEVGNLSESYDEEDLQFAAEMTKRQFEALRIRLNRNYLSGEIESVKYFERMNRSSKYDAQEFRKWIRNGWNTERILRLTSHLFKDEELAYALQWAFPQAYYSTYALIMAFFVAQTITCSNHSTAMKHFGELVEQGKYPPSLSFLAVRVKQIQFLNIKRSPVDSSLSFDPNDQASVETQIECGEVPTGVKK